MADHILFKKEDDFGTTFLVGCWLADPMVIGQMGSFQYKMTFLYETKHSK